MAWRILQGEECNKSYSTLSDEPCVPAGDDLDCSDLKDLGISRVEVVGPDDFRLDFDGDGTACEANAPRTVTGVGDTAADVAPFVLPLVVLALLIVVGLLLRMYRQADSEAERRGYRIDLPLLLIAIPLGAFGGAAFLALVGIS